MTECNVITRSDLSSLHGIAIYYAHVWSTASVCMPCYTICNHPLKYKTGGYTYNHAYRLHNWIPLTWLGLIMKFMFSSSQILYTTNSKSNFCLIILQHNGHWTCLNMLNRKKGQVTWSSSMVTGCGQIWSQLVKIFIRY